ncbi:hypothetical protein GGF31_002599 [Allomyces arbusculus]|nr:hypothetical protein GGF31_002599 [Allomyces arbusculus]
MVYRLNRRTFGINWYSGKNTTDSMGPQAFLLTQLKDDELLIKYLVNKGTNPNDKQKDLNLFGKCTLPKLLDLLEENHCIQEILHPKRLFKVFFDIDDKLGVLNLEDCKRVILEQFPGAAMQICGYQVPEKSSWHIVLSNYTAEFKDLHLLQSFALLHKATLGFDESVYTTHRAMKCINQSKPKKHVARYIEGSTSISKHLIQVDFDEQATSITTLTFPELPKIIKEKGPRSRVPDFVLDIPDFEGAKIDPDFFFYDAKPLDILNNIPHSANEPLGHNVVWRIMVWCYRRGLTFNEFMAWNGQKDNSNDRIERYHGYWQDVANNEWTVSDSFMEAIYAKVFPSALKSKALKKFNASMRVTPTHTSKQQYLSAADIRHVKFNVLATGMGSNKTGAVCDYLSQFHDARIVWITPRITLAHNTEGRLAEEQLGFVNYKTVVDKKSLDTYKRLIVSPCSLHYIKKPYDIVVVDESETVLSMYVDDTLHKTKKGNNLVGNLLAFKSLMEAGRCNFMDAFVSNMTMDVIKSINYKPDVQEQLVGHVNIVKNTLPDDFEPRKMLYISDKPDQPAATTFYKNIVQDLRDNKKLYVFIPRKSVKTDIWAVQNFAEHIAMVMDWQIGKEIKVYHGDRPAHENSELVNPDDVWGSDTVRLVVANTKITVGVNFSKKNVFHRVYARYESWVSPRDFFQAIYRIRHPIDNEIVFMSVSQKRPGVANRIEPVQVAQVADLHAAIVNNAQLEKDMAAVSSRTIVFDMFRKLANISIGDCPDYFYHVDPVIKSIAESGWSFSWKNVAEIDDQCMEAYIDGELSNPNWEEWLGIRKRFFLAKFKTLSEELMQDIWDDNAEDFMDKIKSFYETDVKHVLHDLLSHNNMDLRQRTPFNVRATIPDAMRTRIKEHYRQLRELKVGNATMLSKLINVYFNKTVVKQCFEPNQVKIDGKRYPNLSWTELAAYFSVYDAWVNPEPAVDDYVLEMSDDEMDCS